MAESFTIAPGICEQIDQWTAKYPPERRRSAVVAALLLVQEQNNGWLSREAMEAVAEYLKITTIEVYEVATFYDMYELNPVGKHKISVCTNIACMLRGSDQIVDYLKQRLGVGLGETTKDGKFTLRESECLAACGGAPMCQTNNRHYHENLTPQKMGEIIDQLEKEGEQNA